MRIYKTADEERVRLLARVRDWTRSGLLDQSQRAAVEPSLQVDLRRTNTMLRAGVALFTAIVVAATILLVGVSMDLSNDAAIATLLLVGGLACYGAAEWLVSSFKLYRHGAEETLAVAATVLVASATFAMPGGHGWSFEQRMAVALSVGAAAALWVYVRFGFVYAAVGALVCAAAVPFQPSLPQPARHLLSAVVLACGGAIARIGRARHRDDFTADDHETIQAAAFAGVYLVLNLQLSALTNILFAYSEFGSRFYWFTYSMTWVIPPIGLWIGIRDRDRKLIDVSGVLALATLVTNKPYLGWPRHPWDPILLGVLLVAIAAGLRRWLLAGPGGERRGFTPVRLLASDNDLLARIGTAAVVLPQPVPPAEAPPSAFSGGRSGGGGGGAEF